MWWSKPLMTVSTADIPVLHSVEVAHLYPQVMLPICQGIATSHTPWKNHDVQEGGELGFSKNQQQLNPKQELNFTQLLAIREYY
jgi:hypothetical protein